MISTKPLALTPLEVGKAVKRVTISVPEDFLMRVGEILKLVCSDTASQEKGLHEISELCSMAGDKLEPQLAKPSVSNPIPSSPINKV